MSRSQPAPLAIPGMPQKGQATPVVQSLQEAVPPAAAVAPPSPATGLAEAPTSRLSSRVQPTIAVTVRLGEARYERMKSWGAPRRVTNQDIIVAALDRFFQLSEDERAQAVEALRK